MRAIRLAAAVILVSIMHSIPSVADENESTTITVYSTATPGAVPTELYKPSAAGEMSAYTVPGYAFVKQQRKVKLEAGISDLRFTDVAAQIEPTTVMFSSLTDPNGTSVVEQNYEFDLVSPAKLLNKFIDKPIGLTFIRPNGETELINGILISNAGGQMVLKTEDARNPIQVVQHSAARVNLSELPGGLITKPTLVWKLNAQKAGEHLVRVTYQTNGMTWWADYNLIYEDKGEDANVGTIDLGAWVSIINQSGASYPAAKLKLVAGDVQRAEPPARALPRGAMAMAEAKALQEDQFQEKAFFEYHLYTLQRATTIPDNSTKQIELFNAAHGVPAEKLYVYYGAPTMWGYGGGPMTDRELGVPTNKKVDVYLRFVNDEKSGLGRPLPSGRIRVTKLDPADGSLEFVGENVIDHTPKNEKVLIKLGSAFDVVGERRQTDFKSDTKKRWAEESFEIKVRNRKKTAVKVLVKENLYRWSGWEIREKSHDFEKVDSRTVHFPVEVAPDGEAVVTYMVRYEW